MFIPIGDDNSGRRTTPYVVYGLVAANALMWYVQLRSGEPFTYGFSAVPYEITHGVDLTQGSLVDVHGQEFPVPQYPGPHPIYLTLLSSMFMHGSWMHILGNMLYLWIFGDQIEDLLGHVKFLLFYVACGLAAAFAQIVYGPDSVIPTLGASGAIAGVLGAYLIKHPANRVRVLMFRYITHMPAAVVLGFWIVLQVFSQVSTPAGKASGVAYMAHIGGFIAGVALVLIFGRGRGAAGRGPGGRRPGFFPGAWNR
ncbi:MAG TPA: rhomboid family intramembrane serine protease [Fibrobacteria bacterium]|nr:rhomboid family intramembrane serine protease [Fibrobacteria bacterium]